MMDKMLKPYMGMQIEKSYSLRVDGSIDNDSVIYTAYLNDGDLFHCDYSLKVLKNKIKVYQTI